MTPKDPIESDADRGKGATEDETSLQGQLPHRKKNSLIEGNDSDFPEPGGNPEHTGEPEERQK
jgi:hypothetical protein